MCFRTLVAFYAVRAQDQFYDNILPYRQLTLDKLDIGMTFEETAVDIYGACNDHRAGLGAMYHKNDRRCTGEHEFAAYRTIAL